MAADVVSGLLEPGDQRGDGGAAQRGGAIRGGLGQAHHAAHQGVDQQAGVVGERRGGIGAVEGGAGEQAAVLRLADGAGGAAARGRGVQVAGMGEDLRDEAGGDRGGGKLGGQAQQVGALVGKLADAAQQGAGDAGGVPAGQHVDQVVGDQPLQGVLRGGGGGGGQLGAELGERPQTGQLGEGGAGDRHGESVAAEIRDRQGAGGLLLRRAARLALGGEQLVGVAVGEDLQGHHARQLVVVVTAGGDQGGGDGVGSEPGAEARFVQAARQVIDHPQARLAVRFQLAADRAHKRLRGAVPQGHFKPVGDREELPVALRGEGFRGEAGGGVVVAAVGAQPEDPTRVGGGEAPGVLGGKHGLADAAQPANQRDRGAAHAGHGGHRRVGGVQLGVDPPQVDVAADEAGQRQRLLRQPARQQGRGHVPEGTGQLPHPPSDPPGQLREPLDAGLGRVGDATIQHVAQLHRVDVAVPRLRVDDQDPAARVAEAAPGQVGGGQLPLARPSCRVGRREAGQQRLAVLEPVADAPGDAVEVLQPLAVAPHPQALPLQGFGERGDPGGVGVRVAHEHVEISTGRLGRHGWHHPRGQDERSLAGQPRVAGEGGSR